MAIPIPDVTVEILEKAAATHAKEVTKNLHELISHRGLDFQKRVMSHLLLQPSLQPILPYYVIKREKLMQCEIVCDGLAQAWKGVKSGSGKDKTLARRVIEAAVILVDDVEGRKAAATCIGLNKRTPRRAVARRSSLNTNNLEEKWAPFTQKQRCDTLSKSIIDIVSN